MSTQTMGLSSQKLGIPQFEGEFLGNLAQPPTRSNRRYVSLIGISRNFSFLTVTFMRQRPNDDYATGRVYVPTAASRRRLEHLIQNNLFITSMKFSGQDIDTCLLPAFGHYVSRMHQGEGA